MVDAVNSSGFSLTAQHKEDVLLVEGYGQGMFKMRGSKAEGSMILLPSGFFPLGVENLDAITAADVVKITEAEPKPELVLIGTGEKMVLIPKALRRIFEQAGIGVEFMDTGAAARTYNVLTLEDRRVSALLMAL